MKRLDRYLLGHFLISWMVSLVFFMGMFVIIHFFSRMEKIDRALGSFEREGWTALEGFVHYYGVNFPFVLVEVLPFTVLMGAMWTIQQFSRKRELLVAVTSGVSAKRLFLPLLVCGFLIGLAFSGVKEGVLPGLARERLRLDRLIKGEGTEVLDRLPLIADGGGLVFHIASYEVQSRTARDVDLLTGQDAGQHLGRFSYLAFLEEGPGGPGWYPLDPAGSGAVAGARLHTDLVPKDIEIESSKLLFLSVGELRRMIARNPERTNLRVLQHAHYAYPLASLILLLMGLPLLVHGKERSPYVAAGLSLLLSVGYFSVQSVLQDMGARGEVLDPLLGAWLPVALFGCLGLVLFETMPT